MSPYEPDFDIDRDYGEEGEDTLRNVLGLHGSRFEVKRKRYADGNFYVELWQRPRRSERPSGLQTTRADYWAFVIEETGVIVLVPTARLRELRGQHEMG